MSKLKASEVAVRACEQAIQTMGGWGYIKDFPVEKWYRDAKLYTIFEGTSEIQRLVIGRALRANANTEPLDQRMDAPLSSDCSGDAAGRVQSGLSFPRFASMHRS